MITNEDYYQKLQTKTQQLQSYDIEGKNFANQIMNKSLSKQDIFIISTIDRCLNLIDGFILLLQNRNMTCAGAILRLQMDNCMRVYAAIVAKDKDALFDCLIYDRKICDQKTNDGQKMTDTYLKKAMCKYDLRFSSVYDNTSGYVHLSSKAFYQTINDCYEHTIEWKVGGPLLEKHNQVLLEAADAFISFTGIFFKLLKDMCKTKEQIK